MSAYEIHERICGYICLIYQEETIERMEGPKGHVNSNFQYNGRLQDVLNSIGGQVEHRYSNFEISAFRKITATECWCHTIDILWRVMVVMIQASLILRSGCDGVGSRSHPYPPAHLSGYSLEEDNKYTTNQ